MFGEQNVSKTTKKQQSNLLVSVKVADSTTKRSYYRKQTSFEHTRQLKVTYSGRTTFIEPAAINKAINRGREAKQQQCCVSRQTQQ